MVFTPLTNFHLIIVVMYYLFFNFTTREIMSTH